jgi:hypothetical protein
MAIDLSLGQLFTEAWGYRTAAFEPTFDGVLGDTPFTRVEAGKLAGSPYYATDVLGNEYYLPVEVQVGNDNAEAFGLRNSDGALAGRWNLPYPILSINSRKRIIKTELTERNGPVMELVNIGGYEIVIKGFLINQTSNEFPEDDFTTLMRLYKLNTVLRINNPVTDIALMGPDNNGSDEVVIESLTFPEHGGVKHVRPYELRLCSNEPFNLIDIS